MMWNIMFWETAEVMITWVPSMVESHWPIIGIGSLLYYLPVRGLEEQCRCLLAVYPHISEWFPCLKLKDPSSCELPSIPKDTIIHVQNPTIPASSSMESLKCVGHHSFSLPYCVPGIKAPMEYQPIPGDCAFRDLVDASHIITPCITKSATESSQSNEDMKSRDKHRLEAYKAHLLRRAH